MPLNPKSVLQAFLQAQDQDYTRAAETYSNVGLEPVPLDGTKNPRINGKGWGLRNYRPFHFERVKNRIGGIGLKTGDLGNGLCAFDLDHHAYRDAALSILPATLGIGRGGSLRKLIVICDGKSPPQIGCDVSQNYVGDLQPGAELGALKAGQGKTQSQVVVPPGVWRKGAESQKLHVVHDVLPLIATATQIAEWAYQIRSVSLDLIGDSEGVGRQDITEIMITDVLPHGVLQDAMTTIRKKAQAFKLIKSEGNNRNAQLFGAILFVRTLAKYGAVDLDTAVDELRDAALYWDHDPKVIEATIQSALGGEKEDSRTALKWLQDRLDFHRRTAPVEFVASEPTATQEAPPHVPGFTVRDGKLYAISEDKDGTEVLNLVTACDPRVVEVLADTVTANHSLHVSWGDKTELFASDVVADGAKLVGAFARRGGHITKTRATKLSQYLQDYVVHNDVPTRQVATHMGWVDGHSAFVCGHNIIGGNGQVIAAYHDLGDQQLANALQSSGSLSGWVEAMTPLAKHPRVVAGILAALAAPLLSIVEAGGFTLEYSGRNERGKSSAMAIAMGVWGYPDLHDPRSMSIQWSATRVALERRVSLARHLPVFIDDSKQAALDGFGKSAKPMPCVIAYDVANGVSRARGTIHGLDRVTSHRTIMFSTGEDSLAELSRDQGMVDRVLMFQGSPWAERVDDFGGMMRKIQSHYGVAGPAFVTYVIGHRHAWPAWRDLMAQRRAAIEKTIKAKTGQDMSRIARHLAVLDVAQAVAVAALGYRPYDGPISDLICEPIADASSVRERHIEALDVVADFLASNPHRLMGPSADADNPPPGGWAGIVRPQGIGLFVSTVNDLLDRHGFRPGEVRRGWAEAGVTQCDLGRTDRKIALSSQMISEAMPTSVRVVFFKSQAIATTH